MEYLHGFTEKEKNRLTEQADFLSKMIYEFLDLSEYRNMLEIGCGTGGHTKFLLSNYPELKIKAFDLSATQIDEAKLNFNDAALLKDRVEFSVDDAAKNKFSDNTFDLAFIVWVLEHSPNPLEILKEAHRVLEPGAKIIVTEVYNKSLYLYPECPNISKYWEKYNEIQYNFGGNPNVGINLGKLLFDAGFKKIKTRNLNRHFDKRNIKDRNIMLDYCVDLWASAKDNLLQEKKITEELFDKLLKEVDELKNNEESIMYYCPIQAEAYK